MQIQCFGAVREVTGSCCWIRAATSWSMPAILTTAVRPSCATRSKSMHSLWRSDSHVLIMGLRIRATLGRQWVDAARHVRLWGETIRGGARVHTIGGLSAHADQAGLLEWYEDIAECSPVILVHGEEEPRECLAVALRERGAKLRLPQRGEKLAL